MKKPKIAQQPTSRASDLDCSNASKTVSISDYFSASFLAHVFSDGGCVVIDAPYRRFVEICGQHPIPNNWNPNPFAVTTEKYCENLLENSPTHLMIGT